MQEAQLDQTAARNITSFSNNFQRILTGSQMFQSCSLQSNNPYFIAKQEEYQENNPESKIDTTATMKAEPGVLSIVKRE